MHYQYLNFKNQKDLIEGVILRKLILHRDKSGILVETLRTDWLDILNPSMPFAMQYMSQTPSGMVRDEDKWHVHKYQQDRFVCVSGRILTAIYDPRKNTKTKGSLNLFLMGPEKEEEMYLLVIPKDTHHGFMVISKTPGILLNFPTQFYNPDDEGRVENNQLSWQKVKEDFNFK